MQELLTYEFMQRALAMAVISGLTCGLLGVFVVLLRMSFIGICVSHAAFAGALIGVWLGFPTALCGFVGSVGVTTGVQVWSRRLRVSTDTVVGVIFSVMLSLSMLVLGLLPGSRAEGLNFLWGNLLTASRTDLIWMGLCAVLLIGFIALFFKEIEAVISQKDAAQASGIPVRELTLAMMLIMGLVIAVALKAVGGVLIYALIVTPAATALQTSKSLKTMFIVSGLWGMGASVVGLFLAGLFSIPTGACVVLTATAFLVLVRLLSKGEAR